MSNSDLCSERYDTKFLMNMSSAVKIEDIVDRVDRLSADTLKAPFPPGWFRHILDPEVELNPTYEDICPVGDEELAQPLPFLPFNTLLVTGTAGAGKTSSIQCLAANLNCLITATTVIASQNLSAVLNRSKAAHVQTIFKAFGFTSKHVSMCERIENYDRSDNGSIELQQKQDLSLYWRIISDICGKVLLTDKKRDIEMCETNIIVIDEAGLVLRHILHTVVFFYWFYNALYETDLYKRRRIPCIVCVGSPTQTAAIRTLYNPHTQNKDVRRGVDILSALISDPTLLSYCKTTDNWVIFINNKRCVDVDFGNLLKFIEFGLPLEKEHIEYIDSFVKPSSYIRNPSNDIDMTRLFISHNEVQSYFRSLHEQIALNSRHDLLTFPVYCVVFDKCFEEYRQITENYALEVGPWFKANLSRIGTYSQFIDHDFSKNIMIENLPCSDLDDKETLITCQVKYVKNSSIGVNTKMKICTIGYSGSYRNFIEILQSEQFIDKTSCDQAVYAYSFLLGIIYSGMYSFNCSKYICDEAVEEMRRIDMPFIDLLSNTVDEAEYGVDSYDIPAISEVMEDSCSYSDPFFLKYRKPPAKTLSFDDACYIYNVFKDIFIKRYKILDKYSNGKMGDTLFITYNRSNVVQRPSGEIVSDTGIFHGMLSYATPVSEYTLEGYTTHVMSSLDGDKQICSEVYQRGLPFLVIKDEVGFISVLEHNVAKFIDSTCEKSLHLCTIIDYGIVSKMAMTITKCQGLTLRKVAIDFGDNPKNLSMSQIYVAMSRVVSPDNLIMNLNPMRLSYENNNPITSHIVKALRSNKTMLIF
ncbi:componant of helicase-primase complex HP1 [Suid betaherpesvirus 2]|uniref:Componant of helicase-primase complex HP1 n=1 Tax=Suid betaherpesvirus 2 TaxID=1608255 RepID=U3GS58_9BETA|nr:componant of helicase-primase complex HP1 [Suid betaherpesvirus 2]AGT99269.1 componant of helicase-primase complex HP1 [Suid betaherpesvirus 2]